jgi:hypothetical protein
MSDIRRLPSHFTMAEIPSEEALAVLAQAEIMSQSFESPDRMQASDGLRGSLSHADPEVVAKSLTIVKWLISPELTQSVHEAEEGPLDHGTEIYEDDEGVINIEISPEPSAYFPATNSYIVKNMVQELCGGARGPYLELARESLGILAVLAFDSTYEPEARQAIGRAGKYSPHIEIAELALDSLQGILRRDETMPDLLDDNTDPTDGTGSALIAVHAISERYEVPIKQRAESILGDFLSVNKARPERLKLLRQARLSELTEYSLSFK